MKDHIVEEVRRIREEHAAQFNYDVAAIIADLNRTEAERDWPRASFAPRRIPSLAAATGTAARATAATRRGREPGLTLTHRPGQSRPGVHMDCRFYAKRSSYCLKQLSRCHCK